MNYSKEMTAKMSDADKKAYKDYETKEQAEHDVRVLTDAVRIRSDEKRFQRAKHCAKAKRKEIDQALKASEDQHYTNPTKDSHP